MGLPVITPDNFTGWLKINTNQFTSVKLEEYISQFSEQYLRLIVGDGAYEAIENQTRQKWTDLLGGVYFEDVNGLRRFLPGLTNALIHFIYFEFIRDNFQSTQAGQVQNEFSNSMRFPDLSTLNVSRSRYNRAVIQINANLLDFLQANREYKTLITSSTDNADNTHLIELSNTKYLESGDSVSIDGVEYIVENVTENTSFIIDAGSTGLDFTGLEVVYHPYELVIFDGLEPCGI